MKTMFLLMIASALVSAGVVGGAVASHVGTRRPTLTIDNALSVAQQHVETNHPDVSQHYVDSVRLDPNALDHRGKRWIIVYERTDYMKGGQIILRVYMDKSVETIFGE